MNLRSFVPVLALAAASLTGSALADTFTGTVYNLNNDGTVVLTSTLTYANGTAAASTFTVSSINFVSNTNATYTVGQFLSGGSNLVINPTLAGLSLGSKEIVFTGSVNLVNGQTYTFTHDDGMVLELDDNYNNPSKTPVIYAPSPTVASDSSFTFTGTSGIHTFALLYGENSQAPADLIGPFTPAAVTPEPSSIMLLGSGLLGVAGAIRRRIKR